MVELWRLEVGHGIAWRDFEAGRGTAENEQAMVKVE